MVKIEPGVVACRVDGFVIVAVAATAVVVDPFPGAAMPPFIKTESPVCGVLAVDPLIIVAGGLSKDPILISGRNDVRLELADSAAKLRPMVVGADWLSCHVAAGGSSEYALGLSSGV